MIADISYNVPTEKGENAVVYARYSSHNQGEQSIEGQLAAARSYATARGYSIIHEYVDRAMTGRNDNRDEFQQMLSDCAKKQFQVIIVWKVDRFGRNREEITFNKHRAKKYGVRVEYVAENLPDSPEAVILESVLEGMAEYYSLQLSQNIRRGYRENAKKCKYAGGRIPLGYKLDADKHFIIDPDTAPLVQEIHKRYAGGETITELITDLNARGYRTSSGASFTKNSLRTILKNEKYIGIYDFKNGEIRIEGGVPALVDRDTFNKVQTLLKTNRRAPARTWSRAEYLLTDKLFCGYCGGSIIGSSGHGKTGKKHFYYACVNQRKKACRKKPIQQALLEKYILEKTHEFLENAEIMNGIIDRVWEYYQAENVSRQEQERIEAQLAAVEKSINNLVRAVEAGIFNENTKARMDELDEQKSALRAALATHQLAQNFRLTREHIAYFLQQFRDADLSDRDAQKRLVEVFINSIYLYDDHITVHYNFGADQKIVTFEDVQSMNDPEFDAAEVFDRCAFCSTKSDTAVDTIVSTAVSLFYRRKCCDYEVFSAITLHFVIQPMRTKSTPTSLF